MVPEPKLAARASISVERRRLRMCSASECLHLRKARSLWHAEIKDAGVNTSSILQARKTSACNAIGSQLCMSSSSTPYAAVMQPFPLPTRSLIQRTTTTQCNARDLTLISSLSSSSRRLAAHCPRPRPERRHHRFPSFFVSRPAFPLPRFLS